MNISKGRTGTVGIKPYSKAEELSLVWFIYY